MLFSCFCGLNLDGKAFFVLAFILLGFILLGLIVCVTEKVNGANWADGVTTFFLGRWSHY